MVRASGTLFWQTFAPVPLVAALNVAKAVIAHWAAGASPIPLTTPTPTGTSRPTPERSWDYGFRLTTRRRMKSASAGISSKEGLGLVGEPLEPDRDHFGQAHLIGL